MAPPPLKYWFHMNNYVKIGLMAYFAHLLFVFIGLSGIFHESKKLNIDSCEKITGPSGFSQCEHALMSNTPGIIYAGCDPMRLDYNSIMNIDHLGNKERVNGGIWRVDSRQTSPVVEKFNIDEFEQRDNFHPLGMAIDIDPKTGQELLLVVNLPYKDKASVEVFSVDGLQLTHKRTIRHPKMSSPNSLYVFHDDRFMGDVPSFFFSQDHYFSFIPLKMVENILFGFSYVGFYNARLNDVEKGVTGMMFANGLTGDDEHLYVAETYRRTVKQYKIAVKSYPNDVHPRVTLNYVSEAKFDMAVDNLQYDAQKKEVYVAGHPKPLQFMLYTFTQDKSSVVAPPSQVARWNPSSGHTQLVLEEDGSYFGGATTAIVDGQSLIVSSLVDTGLLICK
ncbi:hypothetical protein BDB01DRAFT_731558 [Pilobolus umbonatus]|nr:hypothetical protein BDB01DRAFT_731558 [Pilobolus umbonatus]